MSFLMSVLGAAAVVAGVLMVAFGIPAREFSFGNTLIMGGITSVVGGLILFGLGAAAAQLQRISEALAIRPPARNNRPAESFETQAPAAAQRPAQAEAPARFPFPPKQRSEPGREQYYGERPQQGTQGYYDERSGQFTPMMRNPEEQPQHEQFEEAPLSPPHMPQPPRMPSEFLETKAPQPASYPVNGAGRGARHHEPAMEQSWPQAPQQTPAPQRQQPQQQQQPAYFDAMWPPAESRAPKQPEPPKQAARPEPAMRSEPAMRPEPPMREQARRAEPEQPRQKPDARAVAILKSGVVDGMGYTLYVDGSIEATLPQGTLRFASINELRSHLEKNS